MHTHKRQLWFLAPAIAALAAVAGCDNDLPLTSQLERTRVVGARVVTASDPGRADVTPGEAATIEWIVLGPTAPATLDWAFAQCRAKSGNCVDALTPVGSGSGTPIVVPFTTPAADALTDGRVPVMMGSVCADGTLGIDPATTLPSCTGPDASGTNAQYVIPFVAAGETANRHPDLSNDRINVGDVEWTTAASGDAGGPCDGSDGAPVVTAVPTTTRRWSCASPPTETTARATFARWRRRHRPRSCSSRSSRRPGSSTPPTAPSTGTTPVPTPTSP